MVEHQQLMLCFRKVPHQIAVYEAPHHVAVAHKVPHQAVVHDILVCEANESKKVALRW